MMALIYASSCLDAAKNVVGRNTQGRKTKKKNLGTPTIMTPTSRSLFRKRYVLSLFLNTLCLKLLSVMFKAVVSYV
jgi:hypothetical protein